MVNTSAITVKDSNSSTYSDCSVAKKRYGRRKRPKQTRKLHSVQQTMQTFTKITSSIHSAAITHSAKLVPETANLDVPMKNLLSDFFSISRLGLGFVLKKCWEMGFRENLL